MKTMILVWGSSRRGKSESIKWLAKRMPFKSLIQPWNNDDYDSYVIGTIADKEGKERIVGIENQGDPGSNQEAWIKACIDADCEIIVVASRSYGYTKEIAYELAEDNGYEVIEVTTLFHKGNPIIPNGMDLREEFDENMLHLIMECL